MPLLYSFCHFISHDLVPHLHLHWAAVALVFGFAHSFEPDHLVAVGNIVSQRQRLWSAARGGLFWGLGHSATLLLIGVAVLFVYHTVHEPLFEMLEGLVGLTLVGLGIMRLYQLNGGGGRSTPPHGPNRLAFGVGLIHGLAGSGSLLIGLLTQMETTFSGFLYLLLFGLGSIGGMLTAAWLFSQMVHWPRLQQGPMRRLLPRLTALACFGLGVYIAWKHFLV